MEALTLGPLGVMPLFYLVLKLGLFENYLGSKKDIHLKWNNYFNFSSKQVLIWFFSVIIQ